MAKTYSRIDGPEGNKMKAEDMEFDILEETWSRFELKDGTIIKIRPVIAKISKALNPDGTVYFDPDAGEPHYGLRFRTVTAVEIPEDALPDDKDNG